MARIGIDTLSGAAALALAAGLNTIIAEQERSARQCGEHGKSKTLSDTSTAYMRELESRAFEVIRELSALRAAAMGRHFDVMSRERSADQAGGPDGGGAA